MIILTIFNTLVSIALISYLLYKWKPLYISVNRTFWMKKITSFTLMKRVTKYSSKGVFTISIRNYNKWEEWDSEQFHNGNYAKLKNK